ncbi:MAG: GvpL/GvpF family gas vesicle protein, partial [Gemmatimonadota bacterium]
MPDAAKYVYCIADLGPQRSFGPLGIGARGDEVTAIPYRDIAAVVSDSPRMRYRVNYENSAAHERAIEAVFAHHTVLPVRFGTLAEDDDDVRGMLELEYGEYRALLDRMRGKMEVGLKAVFDE